MTLDELCELADELGIPGDAQILAREPAEAGEEIFEMFTLEGLIVNNHGQARLILQPAFDTEEVL